MDIIGQIINGLPGSVSLGLIWGIMAIGVYITYRILDVADLTVDGSIATGGAVAAVLMLGDCNPWLALLLAFVAGMLSGAVTGLLHTLMGIPPILAGILTQIGLYTVNLVIMGRSNTALNVDQADLLIASRWNTELAFHNPIFTVGIVLAILIGILYWFFGTEMGSAIRATGINQNMSRAQGINTNFNKVLGIMLSNGLVAFAGAFLAQYQGNADIKMGQGAIVTGLAAIVIGEALFSRVFKNFALRLLAVAIGAIIYQIVYQVVLIFLENPDYLKLISATVVAIFLAIPYWKRQYAQSHMRANKGGKVNA